MKYKRELDKYAHIYFPLLFMNTFPWPVFGENWDTGGVLYLLNAGFIPHPVVHFSEWFFQFSDIRFLVSHFTVTQIICGFYRASCLPIWQESPPTTLKANEIYNGPPATLPVSIHYGWEISWILHDWSPEEILLEHWELIDPKYCASIYHGWITYTELLANTANWKYIDG